MANELKSLTLNGKKYTSFVDETARQNGGGGGTGGATTEQIAQIDKNKTDITQLSEQLEFLDSTLLQKTVSGVSGVVIDMNTKFLEGYLDNKTGDFIAHPKHRTSDFIELEKGVVYQCDIEFVNNNGEVETYPSIACYNADKSFTRWVSMPVDITNISLQNDEKYIRLYFGGTQINLLSMYPKDGGNEPKVTAKLNPNLEIPQLNREIKRVSNEFSPYIHARRPIIAFIFDGDYNLNAEMESVFYNHGVMVGFAPQYTTNFANNSKQTYLDWQEKGHEILAHSTAVLNETTTYTDEEAVEIIKASYATLTGYGFKVHGLIGSHGAIAERFLPTIKAVYDYAATKNNHSASYTGTGAESCLFFATDSPYKLWRYGMQDATLEQLKAAVDRAISECGLLLFYDHASTTYWDDTGFAKVSDLIAYIKEKNVTIKTPYEAIKDYYSIRYEDIVGGQLTD